MIIITLSCIEKLAVQFSILLYALMPLPPALTDLFRRWLVAACSVMARAAGRVGVHAGGWANIKCMVHPPTSSDFRCHVTQPALPGETEWESPLPVSHSTRQSPDPNSAGGSPQRRANIHSSAELIVTHTVSCNKCNGPYFICQLPPMPEVLKTGTFSVPGWDWPGCGTYE